MKSLETEGYEDRYTNRLKSFKEPEVMREEINYQKE